MEKDLFTTIIKHFYFKERYKIYSLFFLSLIAGLFEYMGLFLIFQFVLFLSYPDNIISKNIFSFFNGYGIYEYREINLILGVLTALIYIFKNIYMLIFTKINNAILEDLSLKISIKCLKNVLFGDFLTIKKISNNSIINILTKISIVVLQFFEKYIQVFTNGAIALILIFFLFSKFPSCAITAFSIVGLLSFAEYLYLKKRSQIQNKNYTKSYNEINESILNITNYSKEIRLNNLEDIYLNNAESKFENFISLNKDKNFNSVLHIYFTEISVMFTFILVLVVLFYTTKFDNSLLISSTSTICIVILRLTPAINRMQSAIYSINSNKKSAEELIEFDNLFKNDNLKSSKEKLEFKKYFELKNISFEYKEGHPILENINLKINKGDFIGIVGASGSSKTTLAMIIAGLLKPNKGCITVDGDNIDNNNRKFWQNNIALLSQDFVLLFNNNDKISKNLLKKSGFENINTKNSELSQGQKQGVALLNILAQEKNIIILDEATSSIDVITQEKINELLKEMKGEKTILSIAHRLQILKHCDKIIYIDNGRIIDFDTFKNLENKYDDFRKIVKLSNFTA